MARETNFPKYLQTISTLPLEEDCQYKLTANTVQFSIKLARMCVVMKSIWCFQETLVLIL